MPCHACGWNNPASYTECFNCHAVLDTSSSGKPDSVFDTFGKSNQAAAPLAHSEKKGAAPVSEPIAVYAGVWARIMATLVDLALVGAVMLFAVWLGTNILPTQGTSAVLGLAMILLLIVLLPAILDSYAGGSPGKRLLGIRVVNSAGEAPGLFRSFFRHGLKYTSHFILPWILRIIERALFGGHSTHNLVTGCFVVSRKAAPEVVRSAILADTGMRRFGMALRVVIGAVFAFVVLIIGSVIFSVWIHPSPPNPRADAVRDLTRSAKTITRLMESRWRASGAFASDIKALGLNGPPEGFSSVSLNEESGAIILVTTDPKLSGARLGFYPELKTKRKYVEIKKWRCGSPDLPKEDLPYSCNEDVKAFVR